MRLVLAVLVAVAAAAAPASAAWTPLDSIPPIDRVTVSGYGEPDRPVTLTVSLWRGGAVVRSTPIPASMLLRVEAPTRARPLVLVALDRPDGDRLTLFRVERDGTLRRVWTRAHRSERFFRLSRPRVALATDGAGRVVIGWVEGRALRFAHSGDGYRRTRTAARLLPRGAERASDVGLTIRHGGELVAGVTSTGRRRPWLVLARVTPRGRVLSRQVVPGADGDVELTTTATGRVGLLVEDSGLDGSGECSSDGMGRWVRAGVLERGAPRFRPVVLLDRPFNTVCDGAVAQLLSGSRGDLAIVWGVAQRGRPGVQAIRVAYAPPGRDWTRAATAFEDAELLDGLVDRTGVLHLLFEPTGADQVVVASRARDGRIAQGVLGPAPGSIVGKLPDGRTVVRVGPDDAPRVFAGP